MLSVASPRSRRIFQNRFGSCEEREARVMTSAKSEIQGLVASDDQATQARLTEAEQVAEHQEVAVDQTLYDAPFSAEGSGRPGEQAG